MERQIDRIKHAEKAARDLVEYTAQIRLELENEETKDPDLRRELVEMIEGLEKEAQGLKEALQKWKEDIH